MNCNCNNCTNKYQVCVCKITCCEIQRMPGTAIKGKKQTLIVNPFTGTCQKNIPPPHTHAHTHTLYLFIQVSCCQTSLLWVYEVFACVCPEPPQCSTKASCPSHPKRSRLEVTLLTLWPCNNISITSATE